MLDFDQLIQTSEYISAAVTSFLLLYKTADEVKKYIKNNNIQRDFVESLNFIDRKIEPLLKQPDKYKGQILFLQQVYDDIYNARFSTFKIYEEAFKISQSQFKDSLDKIKTGEHAWGFFDKNGKIIEDTIINFKQAKRIIKEEQKIIDFFSSGRKNIERYIHPGEIKYRNPFLFKIGSVTGYDEYGEPVSMGEWKTFIV